MNASALPLGAGRSVRAPGRSTCSALLVVAVVAALTACGSDDQPAALTGVAPPSTTTATPSTNTASTEAVASAPPTATEPSATSTTAAAPLQEPSVALFDIGDFDQPVEIVERPGDTQLFVVEQPGRVLAVTDLSSDVVLDITDLTDARGEQGLLGLAFHPTDDLAYVNYIDGSGDTVIAEFAVDGATGVFDRASQREVMTVDQPYSNHNGGQLAFGPDQLLYIGLGDGGNGGDPERYALDLRSRLGKILRIDPVATGSEPFAVPADNPFVATPDADPTIWSYGLRNPWRFSFDSETGDLWIADVGQGDFEEINRSAATSDRLGAGRGVNYGWSALEGFEPFNSDQPTEGAVAPVFVYDHDDGRCSVSGGVVARTPTVPTLAGWYVFGDFCTGQIWALDPADTSRVVELAQLPGLAAVSRGPEGELYAVSNGGTVARLVPA